jgi:hypothetical protein
MAATGVGIGVALAYSSARVMKTMLFGLSATDASTYAWVLLAVTPLSCSPQRFRRGEPLAPVR